MANDNHLKYEVKPIQIDTKKLFIFNMGHFIRYLFSGHVLPILLVFSVLFLIISINILFYLIVILMVYKFAFDVLVDTARGNMSPDVRQNYLVTNVVGIKVAFMAIFIEAILLYMKIKQVDGLYIYLFVISTTFLTPAIFMILALTNSIKMAFNPIIFIKLVKSCFTSYVIFALFWTFSEILYQRGINPLLIKYLPVYVNGIVSSFINYALIVLNFHIMGYILFQNRSELNLEDIGFSKIEGDVITIKTIEINPIYQRIKDLIADDEAKSH